jgi:hypothetical protein
MWKPLRTCSTRVDAEMLVGLLETADISSRIISGDTGGITPHLAVATGFCVEVPEDQLDAAEELMDVGPIAPPPEGDEGSDD